MSPEQLAPEGQVRVRLIGTDAPTTLYMPMDRIERFSYPGIYTMTGLESEIVERT